jgi:hypothetical protein
MVSCNFNKLNAQPKYNIKQSFKIKRQGARVNAPGLALIQIYVSEVFNLNSLRQLLEFRLRVHMAYRGNEPYMS